MVVTMDCPMYSLHTRVCTQESNCKTNQRRRVAKRSLNALGGVSGFCGFVNDPKQLETIKSNLKFADSLESIKHMEKELRQNKIDTKRKHHYKAARLKLKLCPQDKIYKSHAAKLTLDQMKVCN